MIDPKMLKKYERMDEELEKSGKKINFMIPLMYDFMGKAFFKEEEKFFRKFLNAEFKDILDIDFEDKKNKIRFANTNLTKDSKNERGNNLDFLIYVNENIIIDIELNTESFKNIEERNWIYIVKVCVSTFGKLETVKNHSVYQLNLNSNDIDSFYGEKITDIFNHKDYSDHLNKNIGNYKILTENIAYYHHLYYNENKKLSEKKLWLLILNTRKYSKLYKILNQILDTDKDIKRFMERMIKLNNDDFILTEAERKALDDLVKRTALENAEKDGREKGMREGREEGMREGREEGLKQGKKEGIKEGSHEEKIKTAKKLLAKHMSISEISEITELSESEILKIS